MTTEKKKCLEQMANVLRAIRVKYPYSNEFVELQSGAKFFDDSFNFVGLHHELLQFEDFLRGMIYFSSLSE